jgi:membrane-associated protease RseP (regulator of RpoE activity)
MTTHLLQVLIMVVVMLISHVLAITVILTSHELAHFLVALKIGLKPESINIGFGEIKRAKTIGKITLNIRRWPIFFGVMYDVEHSFQQSRLKRILVAAAGPLVNVMPLFLAYAIHGRPGEVFTAYWQFADILFQITMGKMNAVNFAHFVWSLPIDLLTFGGALCLHGLFIGVWSLFPFPPQDGFQILFDAIFGGKQKPLRATLNMFGTAIWFLWLPIFLWNLMRF